MDIQQLLHFIDKRIQFKLNTQKIAKNNIYQLYINRYGINKTNAYKLNKYFGTHPYLKTGEYKYSTCNKNIKNYFHLNERNLDSELKRKLSKRILADIEVYSYKGSRYLLKLPRNGQRRKTNANTCKRVRQLDTMKLDNLNIKHVRN